jgi:hypothetical protein
LAKRICQVQDTDDREKQVTLSGWPTIHGGVKMRPAFVEARFETLEKLNEHLCPDGVWGRSSIDDTLWDFICRVADLQPDQRSTGITKVVEDAVLCFTKAPSSWVVDIVVYGFDQGCAGVRFGRMVLIAEDINAVAQQQDMVDGFPPGTHVLARMETTAIDERSAIERAESALDEHLMIINALCASRVPSMIEVSRTNQMQLDHSARRVAGGQPEAGVHISVQHRKFPLAGHELRSVVEKPLGARIHSMLAAPENEFNRRVLLGYQFAGTGCVDHRPERSFLMFAIALESSILEKTETEITYQLATRVAHLIGKGLGGRQLVVQHIKLLYKRRSQIVHAGQYGVSQKEAVLMFVYCMAALGMLAAGPSFQGFVTNSELENWFKDRILDGPNPADAVTDVGTTE